MPNMNSNNSSNTNNTNNNNELAFNQYYNSSSSNSNNNSNNYTNNYSTYNNNSSSINNNYHNNLPKQQYSTQPHYQQSQPILQSQPTISTSSSTSTPTPTSTVNKQAQSDYVYFKRSTASFASITLDKAKATKLKIEHFYKRHIEESKQRALRVNELESKILHSEKWSEEKKSRAIEALSKKESSYLRLQRTRIGLVNFRTIKVIGKGAFGEVRLVQQRETGKIFAMKSLIKSEMHRKEQLAHVKSERDVLAESDSPWIVTLFFTFQDSHYLYLVMEFLPGGDLMTMLIKYDVFNEDITRFYMAEMILAIEAIHKLGFIHRDIKPDNILIDRTGHIKLSDFGLSTGFHVTHDNSYYQRLFQDKRNSIQQTRNSVMVDAIHLTMSKDTIATWKANRRQMAYSTVGTPDYIAPEIFLQSGYGNEVDWWSLGAIMFECLVGWPPFCSESSPETYQKIVRWRETFYIPEETHLSHEAEDLVRKFLTSADQRIGRYGAAEIKAHPFFAGVDWNTIRTVTAPYIPNLKSMTDTSYFPTEDLDNIPHNPVEMYDAPEDHAKKELAFVGFTFKKFEKLGGDLM